MKFYSIFLSVLFILGVHVSKAQTVYSECDQRPCRLDTLIANHVYIPPVVDDLDPFETAWDSAIWKPFNFIWLVNDGTGERESGLHDAISESDFKAEYKTVWSKTTNRLYILVKVTDEVLIKGCPVDGNPDYGKFDVVEVFCRAQGVCTSGCDHTFTTDAYAFHLNLQDDYTLAGAWDIESGYQKINYRDFFTLGFSDYSTGGGGSEYFWEIEMQVPDAAGQEVTLTPEQVLGFSLAYCDNDIPNKGRDHFIGSIWQPTGKRNASWQDAAQYGRLKLATPKSKQTALSNIKNEETSLIVYPNPSSEFVTLSGSFLETKSLSLSLINSVGQVVYNQANINSNLDEYQLSLVGLQPGVYFGQVKADDKEYYFKVVKSY